MEIQEVTAIKNSIKPYNNGDLKEKRQEFGFTAEAFATLLGISRTTLYRMESEPDKLLDFKTAAALRYLIKYFQTQT